MLEQVSRRSLQEQSTTRERAQKKSQFSQIPSSSLVREKLHDASRGPREAEKLAARSARWTLTSSGLSIFKVSFAVAVPQSA